jgi:hypothetical protein
VSATWTGHAACAALVACDLLARSWRLRLLTAGAGHKLGMVDSLHTNLLADAGAAISPMRLAGEPARIAGMRLAGVPLPTTLAALTWEVTVAWPLLAVMTVVLTALAAPAWWASTAPLLLDRVASGWPVLVGLAVLLVLAALWANRWRERLGGGTHFVGHFGTSWRQMPPGPLAASVPLSLINMLTRTALLPALVLTRPDAPDAAVIWFGSFLLIYGQLVLPTPAGAGAVEVGFLGGAVGALEGDVGLLLAWRWWASGAPIVLGLIVAWQARRQLMSWWPARVRAVRPDAPRVS